MVGTFATLLGKLVRTGDLELETADGVRHRFGDGSGPRLGARLADRAAERELLIDPAFYLGELYMDGRFVVTQGSLYEILELGARNLAKIDDLPWVKAIERARVVFRGLHQRNDRRRAKANIAHHYDLDRRIYDLFLDADQQYSCAYFEHPGRRSRRLSAPRSAISPPSSLVDEGAVGARHRLRLRRHGALSRWRRRRGQATGVTLSEEQLAVANGAGRVLGSCRTARLPPAGLSRRQETFDRIVSVGMFEHVGVGHYDEYFQTRPPPAQGRRGDAASLDRAQFDGPGATNPWIRKYIFPGGYIPACRRCCRRLNGRASASPTSRSSDFITPKRCAPGASGSWRTGTKPRRSPTNGSAGCRNSICGLGAAFRVDGQWSPVAARPAQDRLPLTANYIAERENGCAAGRPPSAAAPGRGVVRVACDSRRVAGREC